MNDITNINSNRAQLNSNQSSSVKSRNEAKQSDASENATTQSDRVTLTNTASRLKDIEQQLSSASSIDNARVAEVQSAISNGEYKVDTDRVADKMLAFEDFMNK